MASLTLAALRRLVALYRRGVDGADGQLDVIIAQRCEDLGALLGDDFDVALLCDEPNRVELLASWVENTRQRSADLRKRRDRERADRLSSVLNSVSATKPGARGISTRQAALGRHDTREQRRSA